MTYFYWFLGIIAAIVGFLLYVLRGTWKGIAEEMKAHVKTYAIAYTVGGAIVAVAAGSQFEHSFYALKPEMQASMPWAPYAILFWKPVEGGLLALIAFLNRSIERAQEVRRSSPPTDNQPAKVP